VIGLAALAAVLLRYPGLLLPLDADESGFTLVARGWDPLAGTLYGEYWVARPPVLIALVGLSDAIGGPSFLRVVGAAACAFVVVLSAAVARDALRYAGVTDPARQRGTAAWTAVLTAAVISNTLIDPVSAKGELLGIPFVLTAIWLVLRALNRGRVDSAALALTVLAGVSGSLALGMKQSLTGGLVFGFVLLVGSRLSGRLSNTELAQLSLAGAIGAAIPVATVVGWAVATGVRLDWLWYTIYSYRSDTLEALASDTGGSTGRGLVLLGTAFATGMVLVVAGIVYHHRRVWQLDPALLAATVAVVLVDAAALVLGGQFWPPYLFAMVPAIVLCAVLLLGGGGRMAYRARVLVVAAAVCAAASSVGWAVKYERGSYADTDARSGQAIAAAALPTDTIVSYGGAADLVLSSGLRSPYPYLWSLQMRTRDPGLAELRSVLEGPDAPTWVVMLAPSTSWEGLGEAILPVLEERYVVRGEVCHGRTVWLLADAERALLTPDCED
jgi:hypothetical protein